MTKHVPLRAPIHAQNCQCPRCRHVRGSRHAAELNAVEIGTGLGIFVGGTVTLIKFWPAIAASLPL